MLFLFEVLEETIISCEALVNESEIIGLHLAEKSIQNVGWWLRSNILQWHLLPNIMEVVNHLVHLNASLHNLNLKVPDIVGEGVSLNLTVMESRVTVQCNGDSELLSLVLHVHLARSTQIVDDIVRDEERVLLLLSFV